jgi:hypothetical protein
VRRSQPRRDWHDAVTKRDAEGKCRVCHIERGLEMAHITGRRNDQYKPGTKTLHVHPDSIVPLCPVCHRQYDGRALDLLPHLTVEEQARAVLDAGGITLAWRRLAPTSYRVEVAA